MFAFSTAAFAQAPRIDFTQKLVGIDGKVMIMTQQPDSPAITLGQAVRIALLTPLNWKQGTRR